ncbi:prepilin-type N-terminal cleavage/methylation domain-containing protein [Luteibacter aegosomatissinici]|uniref:prepilin-type N-terminal cleavage/methylation domain-containing protein n=1 Tax=Luteibacter aegosomatissinici TaxID=2911539 RepID=UPI001FF8FD8E|nr:prepilin-type N-terminal cleavage/methylation domain-containing protein [Luteibacter aegosomatissinici]UPG92946.1 prepilin-type N-terminal cleavage/methylation domain-containing protein [Luteibacter aegosomatissinici]
MNYARGFSLLETLAALALLGLVLLGVYSGVRSTTVSVGRGATSVARLDEMRGAREFLRRSLSSATALPWRWNEAGVPVVFEGDARHLRYVSVLPGYLGKLGPQVIDVALGKPEVAGQPGQELQVSLAPLPTSHAKTVEGTQEVLVQRVRGLSVRYAARGSAQWQDQWNDAANLPGAIEIRAVPEEGEDGWPPLVIAPRQDRDAVNVRGAASHLPDVAR